MNENDREYFLRRSEEEAAAALQATSEAARKAHSQLAQEYADRAQDTDTA